MVGSLRKTDIFVFLRSLMLPTTMTAKIQRYLFSIEDSDFDSEEDSTELNHILNGNSRKLASEYIRGLFPLSTCI